MVLGSLACYEQEGLDCRLEELRTWVELISSEVVLCLVSWGFQNLVVEACLMEVLLEVRQPDVAVELAIIVLATVELTLEEVSLLGGLEGLWPLVVELGQVLEVFEPELG